MAVIASLRALAATNGGEGAEDVSGGVADGAQVSRNGGNQELGKYAGGTTNWRYGTAVVGEHGPELITNNGSRAWTVFSNSTLMDEIAHTRHALNLLSNSAEVVAYNRIVGTGTGSQTTDNSQNITNQFGTIVGDSAFEAMVEEKLTNVVRRELRLAR